MKASTQIDYQARIDSALRWMSARLDEEVAPADVAQAVALSPFHFHRIFRGVTGESVMQCLRRLRLEAAARQLWQREANVIDVALAAGYNSHEGFTRAFKDHFGEAPDTWRHQHREFVRVQSSNAALQPLPAVEVRDVPPVPFISMAYRGSFAEVGQVWERFIGLAASLGIFTGSEQLIGRYPDDPDITPAGKIRFDVGLRGAFDAARTPLHPALHAETLPAGRWAVAVHRGSYATLHETYLSLVGGWVARNGYVLDDRPCLEWYLNSPATTAEADLRTEVWAPLYLAG